MWRYLKAAFSYSPELPGVGRFPANMVAVSGFLILGLGHEAFWLLGLGLEAAYLTLMATNPRFQKLVQVQSRQAAIEDDEDQQEKLVKDLPGDARARLQRLQEQFERLSRLGSAEAEAAADADRQALRRLEWLFLKLLVAQQHLQSEDAKGDAARLDEERKQIEEELRRADLSQSLRRSKEATLRILSQRCANVARRTQGLEEIASDLKRIEEQVKLALEDARLKGDRTSVSFDVDLESELLEDSYGAAGVRVAAIDQLYASSSRPPSQKIRS